MVRTKDGFSTSDVVLDSYMNGWYVVNYFFGPLGIPGLVIIDPLTGAMWKLPPTAHADLTPATAAKD